MEFLLFCISLLASIVGAICGIGGGVIIKPVLDMFSVMSVTSINFLSGCTVLAMSCYSVLRNFIKGDNIINLSIGTPLAIGAAIGGVIGKGLFSLVFQLFKHESSAGALQAFLLLFVTLLTLIYTLKKSSYFRIKIQHPILSSSIGLILGIISSFLGIGGGPINLVALTYFFQMDTKTAAQNSLYIILFSQITSFLTTIISRSVPLFQWNFLILMVIGGILGGFLGKNINYYLNNKAVEKLFVGLMMVIILISLYNGVQYTML